jgi:predicted nucleic acid-binding Zn ribbon protein
MNLRYLILSSPICEGRNPVTNDVPSVARFAFHRQPKRLWVACTTPSIDRFEVVHSRRRIGRREAALSQLSKFCLELGKREM